jgi:hypothetical protein
MSVSAQVAVAELRKTRLVDPSAHLKPKGREEVLQEIQRWASRGLVAHVLVVDLGDSFSELLRTVWDRLALDSDRDLLLIFDTRDWVARGWGLDDASIERALTAALPHQRTVFSRELIGALDGLGQLAEQSRTHLTSSHSSSALPITLGIGAAAALGVLGLVIRRRNQLAKAGRAKLAEVERSAERTYSELILACEELSQQGEAAELQLRATELKRRVDDVLALGRQRPSKGNDPVTLGEVRQLEDEMSALRSTVLQKMKET